MAWLLFAIGLALGGCSSSWKAPLETRTGSSPSSSSVAQKKPKQGLPGPDARSYRVQSGDTLYAIAWRSNKDFRDIARWNGIRKPYTIYKGQWLRLEPRKGPSLAKAQRASSKSAKPTTSTKPAKSKSASVKKSSGKAVRKSSGKSTETSSSKTLKRTASSPQADSQGFPKGPLRWDWPIRGKIRSTYKRGDPLRKGVKIAGRPGDPIRAAEGGKVVYSGSGLIGYGRLIIVKHNDKYLSAYGHNRKLLVSQGQHVTKGQQIAEMGTSNDGKPLLHFEIRRDGKPVNPLALLPRR